MQQQMMQLSLLDEPPSAGAAPVWAALDRQQRNEVVEALARLIAKVAEAPSAAPRTDDQDQSDE